MSEVRLFKAMLIHEIAQDLGWFRVWHLMMETFINLSLGAHNLQEFDLGGRSRWKGPL